MERTHAGACRSHEIERVLSDTQNGCGHHHEAGRRMLRRETHPDAMHLQVVDTVDVNNRNRRWRQDQSRNILGWKQGTISWRLRHAADIRRPLAARISLRLTAVVLSPRSTRDDCAGTRQRHHQDEHQNRGDSPETLHTMSISGSPIEPYLHSKDSKLPQLRMQFMEAGLLLIRRRQSTCLGVAIELPQERDRHRRARPTCILAVAISIVRRGRSIVAA